MIGTSDGEQYNTPLEHSMSQAMGQAGNMHPAIASSMPVGGPTEVTGALKSTGSYQSSGDKSSDLDPRILSVLSQPHLVAALANPKIDRTHEVPYVAGASSKPDDFTTHIDKSVPATATVSGKTFDTSIPLNIHEQLEREVMQNLKKRGMSDNKAYEIAHHEFAEPAEDAWYRSQGIDVNEVNKFWKGIDTKTEKDKGDFPPNLYKAPYPHDKVEGVKHEPSNVNQEWTMAANIDAHKPITPEPGGGRIPGGGAVESIYSPAVLHEGSVHMGGEHGEAYRNAYKATGVRPIFKDENQGYVTSKGRFVSRHEAIPIAEEAKQVIPTKDLTSMERKSREEFGLSSHELP